MTTTRPLLRPDLLADVARTCAELDTASAADSIRRRLVSEGVEATVTVPDDAGDGVTVSVPDHDELAAAIQALLEVARQRDDAAERLDALTERFDTNQRLSGVGSYDWHIASNTNLWTDRLFHIYGEEPGAVAPSYEEFLARVHPDDRERVRAVHQRTLEERGHWEMHERIIRPDGQVRTLATTGEVICDEQGQPLRLVGVCEDVTEKLIEEERIRVARERIAAAGARRAAAMELNDNVVQGLTAVIWAIEAGLLDEAGKAAEHTMAAARGMLDRMLPEEPDELEPGQLVRTRPAPSLLAGNVEGGE